MNTTESAAAVSGDPAAAAIRIQTNTHGQQPAKRPAGPGPARPAAGGIACGWRRRRPVAEAGAEQRLDRQIARQLAQLGPGLRGVRRRHALLELVQRQPSVRERVAQDIYDAFPLLVGRADRPVGHRRRPRTFPVLPSILPSAGPIPVRSRRPAIQGPPARANVCGAATNSDGRIQMVTKSERLLGLAPQRMGVTLLANLSSGQSGSDVTRGRVRRERQRFSRQPRR